MSGTDDVCFDCTCTGLVVSAIAIILVVTYLLYIVAPHASTGNSSTLRMVVYVLVAILALVFLPPFLMALVLIALVIIAICQE